MEALPLGLLPAAVNQFGDKLLNTVRNLEREPLDRVKNRLARFNQMSPEDITRARLEFLRFYSLFSLDKGPFTSPYLADKFTHEFMLFSRDYAAFCERHFGQFIHHDPLDVPSDRDPTVRERTIKMLAQLYGFQMRTTGTVDRFECNGEGDGGCNDEGTGSTLTRGAPSIRAGQTLFNLRESAEPRSDA